MHHIICEAIYNLKFLALKYDDFNRIVEPYSYGLSDEGHELLRAYQVLGGSESGETTGWKLLRVDEIQRLAVLEDDFTDPRPGYRRNDSAMTTIFCQL